jgi:hypothetical protein
MSQGTDHRLIAIAINFDRARASHAFVRAFVRASRACPSVLLVAFVVVVFCRPRDTTGPSFRGPAVGARNTRSRLSTEYKARGPVGAFPKPASRTSFVAVGLRADFDAFLRLARAPRSRPGRRRRRAIALLGPARG